MEMLKSLIANTLFRIKYWNVTKATFKLPLKVISGGQSGADYAGLVSAAYFGISTGGTAPKGWRIKLADGSDSSDPTLSEFGLSQHESSDYDPRTVQNVLDSDATVWFGYVASPGGQLTQNTAKQNQKPFIVNPTAKELAFWIAKNKVEILNVSGNAKSAFNPNIYEDTYYVLRQTFVLLDHYSK